tara:strand:- start:441 stop:629 length:189 start_codon:yes stop_codon:yes gene_type:complete
MRTTDEIMFQIAIEKVAQHIVEESEDVRTEVEMLLVDKWGGNKDSFFKAYSDIINDSDEGVL